jgi:hypothetical protein
VLSGQWNGTTLVYADYEFTEDGQNSGDQDDKQNPNQENANQTYAFSAVVADLGCRMPQVDVMARSMAGGLAEELGVQGVEFDNDLFNDRYVVESEDERFAQELIDDKMIDVLMQCPPDLHVQLGPQRMVVWGQRRPTIAIPLVLDAAAALDHRVPVVVRQEHSLAGSVAPPS